MPAFLLSDEGLIPAWATDIISYLHWSDRGNLAQLCRAWSKFCASDMYWRLLLERLEEEHLIYTLQGPSLPSPNQTWKGVFLEAFSRRHLWSPRSTTTTTTTTTRHKGHDKLFSLSVGVRFRPPRERGGVTEREEEEREREKGEGRAAAARVVLPLHQTFQLVKASNFRLSRVEILQQVSGRRFQCAARAAAMRDRVVKEEEEEEEEEEEGDMVVGDDGMEEKEAAAKISRGFKASLVSINTDTVVMVAPGVGLRHFALNVVLPPLSSQAQAYECSAKPLVADLMNGYNTSLLVYGQTGSGKTYTMFGQEDRPTQRGIVYRACLDILAATTARCHRIQSKIAVSFIEIFGEVVTDLLREGSVVGKNRAASQRYVLDGTAEVEVSSAEEVEALLKKGNGQKRLAATLMNERSSRAHTIFIINVEQRLKVPPSASTMTKAKAVVVRSKMYLTDLGGSEQLKKSQAQGVRMREAININLGLLSLKKVMKALKEKHKWVPYGESRLTLLLSDALGGNAKTSMIITGATDDDHALETYQSLRFGETCALVEKRATSTADMVTSTLAQIEQEIKTAEEQIKRHERWVVHSAVLEGAEEHRARLERALYKKIQLLGQA